MKAKRNAVIYLTAICVLMIATLVFACIRDHHKDASIRCYQGINAIQAKEIANRDAVIDAVWELIQLNEEKNDLLSSQKSELLARIEAMVEAGDQLVTHYDGRLLTMERVAHTREMELLAEIKRLNKLLEDCVLDEKPIEPAPPIPGCK